MRFVNACQIVLTFSVLPLLGAYLVRNGHNSFIWVVAAMVMLAYLGLWLFLSTVVADWMERTRF